MGKSFIPFLEDVPLSYAYEHPQFYRNRAREEAWGSPVYFAPSNIGIEQYGTAGPYYVYGKPSKKGQGKKGNCTWFAICRHHETSGEILTEAIGSADEVFSKYRGRKDGGNFKNKFIGDTLQPGDFLIWTDDTKLSGDGHINRCEAIIGRTAYISESGYSDKSIYEDKTCIVYTLNIDDLYTGKVLTLRPKMPYKEIFYGICHTGDVFTQPDPIQPVDENPMVDQLLVISRQVNMRTSPSLQGATLGYAPTGYYNAYALAKSDGYTWVKVSEDNDIWIAIISGNPDSTTYIPKKDQNGDIENLKEELEKANNLIADYQAKLDRIAEICKY